MNEPYGASWMASVVHICTCFDQKNADAAFVMISSAIKNRDKSTYLFFHIIATCDEEYRFKLLEAEGVSVAFCKVTNAFEDFQGKGYISQATYLRFMIRDLLPECIGRVLYLDADIIVLTDLSELYLMDLKGRPLAAMPDYGLALGSPYWQGYRVTHNGVSYQFNEYCESVLKISNKKTIEYFNAGVILIELKHWGVYTERSLAFLAKNPGLPFLDQDALSYALGGNFIPLHPSYNAFSDLAAPDGRSRIDKLFGFAKNYHAVKKQWREHPKIIHYAGANKPWDEHAKATDLERYWWDYAEATTVFPRYARFADRKRFVKAEPRRV